jgi:spore maturation protein CgeB
MRLAIFGLSVTSSWGNGHATFWRALCRALARRGSRVAFFERDRPFYRAHRDLAELPDHDLFVYDAWDDVAKKARAHVREADAAIVTSYCGDAAEAADLIRSEAAGVRVFYDMDTPVTLERLHRGETVEYLPAEGFTGFDLVLSYSGGPSLEALERELGARRALPLYGCIDPVDYPLQDRTPKAAVTYLGTYAEDREAAFDRLLIGAARLAPSERFVVGGPQYPNPASWPPNVRFQSHVPQYEHLAFYGSGRFTLNLTRGAMAAWGFCPSARLFEAAACGTPLLTDRWPGLTDFFEPGADLVVVDTAEEVVAALQMGEEHRQRIRARARDRVLGTCTAEVRVVELERALESAREAAA